MHVHVHVALATETELLAKAAPQTWASYSNHDLKLCYIYMSIVDAWPFTWKDSMSIGPSFPSESVQTLLFEELGHRTHAQKLWSGDKTS